MKNTTARNKTKTRRKKTPTWTLILVENQNKNKWLAYTVANKCTKRLNKNNVGIFSLPDMLVFSKL